MKKLYRIKEIKDFAGIYFIIQKRCKYLPFWINLVTDADRFSAYRYYNYNDAETDILNIISEHKKEIQLYNELINDIKNKIKNILIK